MRLSYRGQGYEYEPVEANTVDADVIGRDRWPSTTSHYPRHLAVPPTPRLDVPHQVISQRQETEDLSASPFHPDSARQVHLRLQQASTPRSTRIKGAFHSVHLQTIYDRLQHRIQVASDRGDQRLVAQLQNEMRQMACPI